MSKYEINYSKMTADTVNIKYNHNLLKVEVKPKESDKLSTLKTDVLNKTESVSVKTVKTDTEVTVKKDKPKKVVIPDIYDDVYDNVYDNAVNTVVAVPDSNPIPVTDNETGFSSWMFLVPLVVIVLLYILFGKKEEPKYSYDDAVYKGSLGEKVVSNANAIRKLFT